jgi:hypothetical protein
MVGQTKYEEDENNLYSKSSNRAGGHWRTHATTDTPVQCDWDVQTHVEWTEMLNRERAANGGRILDSPTGLKV